MVNINELNKGDEVWVIENGYADKALFDHSQGAEGNRIVTHNHFEGYEQTFDRNFDVKDVFMTKEECEAAIAETEAKWMEAHFYHMRTPEKTLQFPMFFEMRIDGDWHVRVRCKAYRKKCEEFFGIKL